MLFQVKDTSGRIMFYTEYESCIPITNLDSMSNAGLVFYLDGKKASATAVRAKFKDSNTASVSKISPSSNKNKKPTEADTPRSAKCKPRSKTSKIAEKFDFSKVEFSITSRTIVCLTNGKVYKNQSEAAKDLGIDPSYISDCVCHNKEYKGLKFKKAVELK